MITRLPQVFGNATTGQAMPPNAVEFVRLWLQRLGERAQSMTLDDRLTNAAQLHASWLPTRTPQQMELSGHIGQNGSSANERVRAEGYRLPDWYAAVGNNVESYRLDHGGPQAALDALLASAAHREHVLGLGLYADQLAYGIGFADGYYVFVAAPKEAA